MRSVASPGRPILWSDEDAADAEIFMRRCLILIGLLAVAPPFAADAETLASQSFVCNNKATWERIGSIKDSNDAQS